MHGLYGRFILVLLASQLYTSNHNQSAPLLHGFPFSHYRSHCSGPRQKLTLTYTHTDTHINTQTDIQTDTDTDISQLQARHLYHLQFAYLWILHSIVQSIMFSDFQLRHLPALFTAAAQCWATIWPLVGGGSPRDVMRHYGLPERMVAGAGPATAAETAWHVGNARTACLGILMF